MRLKPRVDRHGQRSTCQRCDAERVLDLVDFEVRARCNLPGPPHGQCQDRGPHGGSAGRVGGHPVHGRSQRQCLASCRQRVLTGCHAAGDCRRVARGPSGAGRSVCLRARDAVAECLVAGLRSESGPIGFATVLCGLCAGSWFTGEHRRARGTEWPALHRGLGARPQRHQPLQRRFDRRQPGPGSGRDGFARNP